MSSQMKSNTRKREDSTEVCRETSQSVDKERKMDENPWKTCNKNIKLLYHEIRQIIDLRSWALKFWLCPGCGEICQTFSTCAIIDIDQRTNPNNWHWPQNAKAKLDARPAPTRKWKKQNLILGSFLVPFDTCTWICTGTFSGIFWDWYWYWYLYL